MRFIREFWWMLLLYAVFLSCHEAWRTWERWMQPLSAEGKSKIVTIAPGQTFSSVALMLENEGIIRSRKAFSLLAWWKDAAARIQAGEYRLSPARSPEEILLALVNGRVLKHLVTIPEGYNIFDIADLLDQAGLVPRDAFLSATRDQDLLESLGIEGRSAEGFLFPDTYFLTKELSARKVVRSLVERFWEVWELEDFGSKASRLGVDPRDVVVLASIVEKEAMLPAERPVIAGVFWNRIERGMPLQADPTVRYGILLESEKKPGRLRWSDLRKNTPYNTYTVKGLPEGPIANPGLESLKAVLDPDGGDYLYFVSKNNGAHHFSRTLREHNRAVDVYQRRRRQKTAPEALAAPTPVAESSARPSPTETPH